MIPPSRPRLSALQEADQALLQGRHAAALRTVERALHGSAEEDVRLRLRLIRGLALWHSGQRRAGAAEVEKLFPSCRETLTRGRALQALALFAWKGRRVAEVGPLITQALALHRSAAFAPGLARSLLKQAGVARDCGRLGESLEVMAQALEEAARSMRPDLMAEVKTARGSLLAALGRWQAARDELSDATALFAAQQDPREHTRVGLTRAIVDLAGGELGAARAALLRAREAACPEGSDPATLGEIALLRSDLLLAVGGAEGAYAAASEALTLFARAGSGEGESRSRVRLAHCLLAHGRAELAVPQARRALQAAEESRPDLRAMAFIALGRSLLQTAPAEAERAFALGQGSAAERPAFLEAARLGVALARGCARSHPEVAGPLAALERWGDRRILSHCLAAVDEALGRETAGPGACVLSVTEPDEMGQCLAEAASALSADEPWPMRWALAMRAVQRVLPWYRAVLVGQPGLELRRDLEEPEPASREDLAFALASRSCGPWIADLTADPVARRHPQRVLHALGWALLAPIRQGLTLYADTREGDRAGQRELGVLVQLARLFERNAPTAEAVSTGQEVVLPPAFAGIVGRCDGMRDLLREAASVAAGPHAVHVFGETGTGKERLAAALHRASRRAGGPWIPVNASSLADELFESEMFGHVKGAFTGALADRRGYVPEADGGTLFLDEVTDLSPKAQAKLLRFLQEGEYRRLGEPCLRRADVRIVTASNVPLEERVQAGRFRSDLMYRLNQHVLTLPPLRERGDDVLLLARHCLRRAAEVSDKAVPLLSREAASLLLRYSWPGNVRELESEMTRALVRSGGGSIRSEHLSSALSRPAPPVRLPLKLAVDAFEREQIRLALERNRGNRSRTAIELGLSRQALLAKMNRLGVMGV